MSTFSPATEKLLRRYFEAHLGDYRRLAETRVSTETLLWKRALHLGTITIIEGRAIAEAWGLCAITREMLPIVLMRSLSPSISAGSAAPPVWSHLETEGAQFLSLMDAAREMPIFAELARERSTAENLINLVVREAREKLSAIRNQGGAAAKEASAPLATRPPQPRHKRRARSALKAVTSARRGRSSTEIYLAQPRVADTQAELLRTAASAPGCPSWMRPVLTRWHDRVALATREVERSQSPSEQR